MIVIGRFDRANRRIVMSDGGRVALHKTQIITSNEGDRPSPNAYLVEQDPHVVVRSHFHIGSQFQLIVAGSGLLGRRFIEPFVVQYVAPHTGYGPITAGENGLAYLTLRPMTAAGAGAQYLPDFRDKLDSQVRKRQTTSKSFAAEVSDGSVEQMVAPTADGLAAWIMHVLPEAVVTPPVLEGGSGRFYVVAKGEMHLGGERLQQLDTTWVSANEPGHELQAGPTGLAVIVMQFPGDAM